MTCGKPIGFSRCNLDTGHAGGCGFTIIRAQEDARADQLLNDEARYAEIREIDARIVELHRRRAELVGESPRNKTATASGGESRSAR